MTVHIIGNGSVCAVYDGASVTQAFGPTYSSPNAFTMWAGDGWSTRRIRPGVFVSERDGVTVTDFAGAAGVPTLMRRIEGQISMEMTFSHSLFPVPAYIAPNSFLSECHSGELVYAYEFENDVPHGYVSGIKRYFAIRLFGTLCLSGEGTARTLTGEGDMLFAFGNTPEEVFGILADAGERRLVYFPPLETADEFVPDFVRGLSPARRTYERQILGVYDTIISQQSLSGGVLAGYAYHLCYLRDNYGVYRGLREMAAHREADELAHYYIDVFSRYGCIHNAQGPDEFAFHVHENDNVEITAYFTLILCDYLRRCPNRDTEKALAGITWALEAQHGCLSDGMLPFNGDETYVAGGILTRACLSDGSMEATALYHKSLCEAEKLAAFYPSFVLPDFAATDRDLIESTFRAHFFADGRWTCNCPGFPSPAYRHGVRACGHGFGLCFRNENGDYVCRDCLNKKLPLLWQGGEKRYAIPAAILCPSFIDSPLIPVSERISSALAVLFSCEATGCGTGYDLGFVLWTLCEPEALENPDIRALARGVRDKLLTMSDDFGAYSEYFRNGFSEQAGTRCRPWESGINIAAILRAADVL